MTPEQLKEIMTRQNLSVMDLATISGASKRQVIAWRQGEFQIPMTLAYILLALEEKIISQDWLVDKVQSELKGA